MKAEQNKDEAFTAVTDLKLSCLQNQHFIRISYTPYVTETEVQEPHTSDFWSNHPSIPLANFFNLLLSNLNKVGGEERLERGADRYL